LRYFHPGERVAKERGRLIKLSRVNLSALQIEENTSLIPKCRKVYDLISCEPYSDETFRKLCTLVDCDIISIDFSRPLPFRLHAGHVGAALKRGVVFEVCYSKLLQDETTRRNVFSGARLLCRCTRGKGVILSSGARNHLDLRTPFDIANIATLLDLKGAQAKQSVASTRRTLVDRVVRNKFFQRGFCQLQQEQKQDKQEEKTNIYGKKRQKV
jgi:ribonuclease P/MRP protein subunit RPP1